VQKNIDVARVRGRIVCAGRVAGIEATVNIDEFSRKQLQMVGVTNRTRSLEERFAVVRQFERDVLPALESGTLVPVIDRTYPLQDAEAAQDFMTTNRHFGKILLVAGAQ
jgi:NADPH:quinone reductase